MSSLVGACASSSSLALQLTTVSIEPSLIGEAILCKLQEDKLLKVKQIRSCRLSGGTTVSQASELVADEDNEEEDNNDSPFTVGEEIVWG